MALASEPFTLSGIATAAGLKLAQMSVNRIDVVGETERFHDGFIAGDPDNQ